MEHKQHDCNRSRNQRDNTDVVGAVITVAKHFIGVQKISRLADVLNTKSVLAQYTVKVAGDAFTELGGLRSLKMQRNT